MYFKKCLIFSPFLLITFPLKGLPSLCKQIKFCGIYLNLYSQFTFSQVDVYKNIKMLNVNATKKTCFISIWNFNLWTELNDNMERTIIYKENNFGENGIFHAIQDSIEHIRLHQRQKQEKQRSLQEKNKSGQRKQCRID